MRQAGQGGTLALPRHCEPGLPRALASHVPGTAYLCFLLPRGHLVPPQPEELLLHSDEPPPLPLRQLRHHGRVDVGCVGPHALLGVTPRPGASAQDPQALQAPEAAVKGWSPTSHNLSTRLPARASGALASWVSLRGCSWPRTHPTPRHGAAPLPAESTHGGWGGKGRSPGWTSVAAARVQPLWALVSSSGSQELWAEHTPLVFRGLHCTWGLSTARQGTQDRVDTQHQGWE